MSITRASVVEIIGLTKEEFLEKVGGSRAKNFKSFASDARLTKICTAIRNDWESFTGLKKHEVIVWFTFNF